MSAPTTSPAAPTVPVALGRPSGNGSQESPTWVRVSGASAIALRLRSGRFGRSFAFGGINLLLTYDDGCRSDCAYCGLARTRPGTYDEKSFIRVEWPLVATDELVARMAAHEERLTRLCISMVTHPRAFRDTVTITEAIRSSVRTPLSVLVAPPTLNRRKLERLADLGVDMIGVGLDAVTEDLFRSLRTEVPAGGAGLSWDKYWSVVSDARDLFGPWKVNCHLLVGLGERDRDLLELITALHDQQVLSYLFCFNPEPDSRLGEREKTPLRRWRRIQLARFLVQERGFRLQDFGFDDEGGLRAILGPPEVVRDAIRSGEPFMTNGCPGEQGEPGCTRPYGSYRPSEPFRDFPFLPNGEDLAVLEAELAVEELLERGRR
ncbi:radical SAM protein [Aciditerrimonas ferrireducens]|jgi:biotin synthase-related radical SAM superfamily protein|uniref:radical SAM protein n=1 Tax=Aciditerrimonas ferrireducens TaxID=667306 RepID=UPI0020034399|nr:radical SAM protein [Aciditerrimonas ferrireducens]MCK4177282.1 radical SAM protein [Aciditerrimonas ferrireducens]